MRQEQQRSSLLSRSIQLASSLSNPIAHALVLLSSAPCVRLLLVQASASTARVLARRPLSTMASCPAGAAGAAKPAASGAAAPSKFAVFKKHWLSDSACYPIMLIIGAACSMVVLAGGRTLMYNPDVHFEKDDRSDMLNGNKDHEGQAHYGHALRKYAMTAEGATQPMYRINKAGWESKMKQDA